MVIPRRLLWTSFSVLSIAALAATAWQLTVPERYHLDTDVYRMGARAFLDGHQLYGDALFETWFKDQPMPFTYPPFAVLVFSPLAWLALHRAGTVVTLLTVVGAVLSIAVVLGSLRVFGGGWRRICVAAAVVTGAVWIDFEPLYSTIDLGQINVILMTLVIADCLVTRTLWPRGVLVGLAMAVKLTPAVFLLYFLMRRDWRAAGTAVGAFAVATIVGFVAAPHHSVQYWTSTVFETERIRASTRAANQNLAGVVSRLGVDGALHTTLWVLCSLAVLALGVWAIRRALAAGERALALVVVALFGLVVSPVSWSHHWVWMLPAIVTTAVLGFRFRSVWLVLVSAAGLVIGCLWLWLLIDAQSNLWVQVVGTAYVWWALAVVVVSGVVTRRWPATVAQCSA